MSLKPLPQMIYRETTKFTDGRHVTRQTFDPRLYEKWAAGAVHTRKASYIEWVKFYIGTIDWAEL